MGFSGNLTVGEILEQVVHADRLLAEEWQTRRHQDHGKSSKLDLVRNIVFMGMGEVRGMCSLCSNRAYLWNFSHVL
jgi:adenine C2-methylase RlmN of 23S rRNA A2503 and tRNA A37